jgi:serine/threonine protein kinase
MPSVGENWKQFRLLEPLGKGGMGRVFLAEDTALDRKVALKFLPESLEEEPQARERFLREAKSAAALDHPYICKIYEIGEVGGRAFIAMEYVKGKTLHERVAEGPLPLAQLLDIGVELAEAVEAAHQKGIVHRDIKTPNIIVTPEGHIKVLDFGVAKMLAMEVLSDSKVDTFSGQLTSSSATPGTVIYMSPEQVRGETVDGRTDVFSLGVVLYEMATGTIPFQGATSGLIYDAILNLGPRPPRYHNPKVPEELERIILKALEKDRDHRYQSAKDLMVDLKRMRRDTDTAPRVPTDVSQRRPTPKTNRKAWLGLGAAVLLIAVAIAILRPSPAKAPSAISSLAVLPFENAQNDPEFDYLGDGISETLINRLSPLPQLQVKARSTTFRYRDSDLDPQQVGEELGVGAVLTGRVVRQGENLNVQAELVDVANGTQLWGEQYNRPLSDIVSFQNQIAQEISQALRLELTGEDEARITQAETANSEAYQAYWRGRFYWNRRTNEDFKKAVELFEEAKKADPDFALAHVGLADSYLLLGAQFYGRDEDYPPSVAMAKARTAARDALALKPDAEAIAWLDSLSRDETIPGDLAIYYARAGGTEQAIDILEQEFRLRTPNLPLTLGNPAFDPMRDEPRYVELNRSMGL